jgi:predicted amidohydrolase
LKIYHCGPWYKWGVMACFDQNYPEMAEKIGKNKNCD